MWFKVLLIVVLVLVALMMLRMLLVRRGGGTDLFVTEATGRSALPKASGGVDASPLEFEVIRLLEQRKKIHAVRLVRQHTGLGLKEAKDLVDEVERTGRLRLPPLPRAPYLEEQNVLDRARELKRGGKAIEAIKLIRQNSELGLKEAKDLYDSL